MQRAVRLRAIVHAAINTDSRGTKEVFLELSPRLYCVVWVAILLVSILNALLAMTLSTIYYYGITIQDGYLLEWVNLLPLSNIRVVLALYIGTALYYWKLVVQLTVASIRGRELTFPRAYANEEELARTMSTLPLTVRHFSWRYFRHIGQMLLAYKQWFELTEKGFERIFLLRETMEVVTQTYQAYKCSTLIDQAWINNFSVAVLTFNCWLAPVIHAQTHTSPAVQRFFLLASDVILDCTSTVVVPFFIAATTVAVFIQSTVQQTTTTGGSVQYAFDPPYDDQFLISLITGGQQILVLTWFDVVTKLLPFTSMASCLAHLMTLVRRRRLRRRRCHVSPHSNSSCSSRWRSSDIGTAVTNTDISANSKGAALTTTDLTRRDSMETWAQRIKTDQTKAGTPTRIRHFVPKLLLPLAKHIRGRHVMPSPRPRKRLKARASIVIVSRTWAKAIVPEQDAQDAPRGPDTTTLVTKFSSTTDPPPSTQTPQQEQSPHQSIAWYSQSRWFSYITRAFKATLSVRTIHGIFIIWGMVVLGLHLQALYVSEHTPVAASQGCKSSSRPWLVSQFSCTILEINCHLRGITGAAHEVDAALRLVDPGGLSSLIIAHCPDLQIPPRVQTLRNLLSFEITNVSHLHWGEDAELRDDVTPSIKMVSMVRTNMTMFPHGLQSLALPHGLRDISIAGSNLTTLSPNVESEWKRMVSIVIERTEIHDVAHFLAGIRPMRLSLMDNGITHIDDDIFADSRFTVLSIAKNPISRWPMSIGNVDQLQKLLMEYTAIADLPKWLVDEGQRRADRKEEFITISAGGSPFCDSQAATGVSWPGLIVDCRRKMDVEIEAYPMTFSLVNRQVNGD